MLMPVPAQHVADPTFQARTNYIYLGIRSNHLLNPYHTTYLLQVPETTLFRSCGWNSCPSKIGMAEPNTTHPFDHPRSPGHVYILGRSRSWVLMSVEDRLCSKRRPPDFTRPLPMGTCPPSIVNMRVKCRGTMRHAPLCLVSNTLFAHPRAIPQSPRTGASS